VWITEWHWRTDRGAGVLLLAIGGLPVLLWGLFVRTVLGLHFTWLVNSATHMWGSRRFITNDTSKNSFWVAILTSAKAGTTTTMHMHRQHVTALRGMKLT